MSGVIRISKRTPHHVIVGGDTLELYPLFLRRKYFNPDRDNCFVPMGTLDATAQIRRRILYAPFSYYQFSASVGIPWK